jgi:hypothetical protein
MEIIKRLTFGLITDNNLNNQSYYFNYQFLFKIYIYISITLWYLITNYYFEALLNSFD